MKFTNYDIVFREIPDETTLAINISGCPCHCPGCHSSYLADDVGEELTYESLMNMVNGNVGITCISFMGGDANPSYINHLAELLRDSESSLRIAWYSGRQELSDKVDLKNFDYIKLGPYIEELGGLDKKTTNQVLYKVVGSDLVDITHRMRDI
jgi:anaerobic ribonucleoside-triphosphate reductase activating protein